VGTGDARFSDARFRVRVERAGDDGYAAWRLQRWCRPPTSGSCTIPPTSGGSVGLRSGASLSSARWVHVCLVVGEVAGKAEAEVSLAQDEHVIQTLAPDRADEPLREVFLPRAVRGRENFTDSAFHPLPEGVAVDWCAPSSLAGTFPTWGDGASPLLRKDSSANDAGRAKSLYFHLRLTS
jgi:hypothetical protein